MSSFWQVFVLIFEVFVFIAYLMILFQIVTDIFRDPELGGFSKALWILVLIAVPVFAAFIYLIVRGGGMSGRQRAFQDRAKADTEAYIRRVAGKSPAEQIAEAKALLDAGAIREDEYARLKAKALS